MAATARRLTLVIVFAGLTASCSWLAAVNEPRPIGPGLYLLPSIDVTACRDVGLDGPILHGSPSDPRLTWLEDPDGERTEVVWPPRHYARFDPHLEVLDEQGHTVAAEGTRPAGACVTGDPSMLLLGYPG